MTGTYSRSSEISGEISRISLAQLWGGALIKEDGRIGSLSSGGIWMVPVWIRRLLQRKRASSQGFLRERAALDDQRAELRRNPLTRGEAH
jgi:hypothetical protein